jgi:hypothetical protein
MNLDKIKLHRLLLEKKITHVHHANTLGTSLTYIEQMGLLSRGTVEKRGLYQTRQKSDHKDKLHKIWHDVFLDTLDLHGHFNRQNHYGPVLFKISIDFLLKTKSEIRITKSNPIHWKFPMEKREKYFASVSELRRKWDECKPEKRMITVRKSTKPILFGYLDEIILDNPDLLLDGKNLHRRALAALRTAINENGLNVILRTRKCRPRCFCKENYMDQVTPFDLRKSFLTV